MLNRRSVVASEQIPALTTRGRRPVVTKVAGAFLAGLLLAACSSPKASPPPASPSASPAPVGAQVDIHNIAFNPTTVTVTVGSAVEWKFDDGTIPHTVTADDHSFDSGTLTSGTYRHTFTTPGTVSYHCTIHASMVATVKVVAG